MKKTVFGTGEWSKFTLNILSGCEHDCSYCYAKSMAVRFKRHTPESWKDAQLVNTISHFQKVRSYFKKKNGVIMYPSTHDITPAFLTKHIKTLLSMAIAGNHILIVSKPHFECIERICSVLRDYKEQILFRFTIGSLNQEILDIWEKDAPSAEERILSLKHAYHQGFKTSISCEPDLDFDLEQILLKFYILSKYTTDSIWYGKMNKGLQRLKCNGRKEVIPELIRLLDFQSDFNIKLLYENLQDKTYFHKIKYKESVKKVLGIEVSTEPGLDV